MALPKRLPPGRARAVAVRLRPGGFTATELLVTVLIIGVLAVMLAPVLQARSETARTITCQANMQKVVTAIRMYMADHGDMTPPDEHRPEVIMYFQTAPGGSSRSFNVGDLNDRCNRDYQANPYLRWPVILDSYVGSRSVWQCPSATMLGGAAWIIPEPDWLSYVQSYEGAWGKATPDEEDGPCHTAWPKGWGGEVTDSLVQGRIAVPQYSSLYGALARGAFTQSIGTVWRPELRLDTLVDPSKSVIVADGGVTTEDLGLGTMAYPDICALDCSNPCCGWADWEACAIPAASCGLYRTAPSNGSFLRHVSLRAPYARHRARFSAGMPMWQRNGVNVGFLDGHVSWMGSEALIGQVRDGQVEGVYSWGPTSVNDPSGGFLTANGFVLY